MKIKKAFSFMISFAISCMSFSAIISSAFNEADWYAEGDTLWGYYGSDTDFILPTELNGNQLKKVAEYFGNGFSWISVTVPEGYTEVGERSFSSASLQSVTLPSTLNTIGLRAFSGCTNSDLVIDIQSTSITSVGSNAFKNVVGTIKVYSQAMYDLISANATTANVVI